MALSVDSDLVRKLTTKSKRLYKAEEIPYKWDDIVKLINSDPEIFHACLRRATNPKYKLPINAPKSYKLWISCNMAFGYGNRDDCYFCGKSMTREEFLSGNVHLEHFEPRAGGGEHVPVNVTIACRECNMLKRDLQDSDFDLILTTPETFRVAHPSMTSRKYQQLTEFAEIIAPRYKGLGWIIERFGVSSERCRQVWDEKRLAYRDKWNTK